MSGQFSAGQFNDAFGAHRLGNWEQSSRDSGRLGSQRDRATPFIANERGHLLPHVPRTFSNPWGDEENFSWRNFPCLCAQQHQIQRRMLSKGFKKVFQPVQFFNIIATGAFMSVLHEFLYLTAEKLPKFFKAKRKVIQAPSDRPQGVKPAVDPILNRIRERRLPIIWVMGLPTDRIQRLRQKFCQELASALNYAYINLDQLVEDWKGRQEEKRQPILEDESTKENQSFSLNPKKKSITNCKRKEMQVCVPAKLSRSLAELVAEYDKIPNRATLAFASHVNTHRKKLHNGREVPERAEAVQSPVAALGESVETPGNLIQFDLSQPLSRDKVMELVKFALIESYPTDGYIVDGIFLDQGDGVCFDKMFYSPAVCTYFTESSVNNLIDEWNRLRNARPPAQDVVTDKEIKTTVSLVPPKNIRRNRKYSFVEVDRLCRLFETKLIRVLNAEEANEETINFVYSLVYKHIKSYPRKSAQAKADLLDNLLGTCGAAADDDDAASDFLSPINSALPTHRESAVDPLEEETTKLIESKLPVIWILGLAQLSTQQVRRAFCHMLTTHMNLTYIKLDDQISKWYHLKLPSTPAHKDPKMQISQRAHEICKRIVDHNDIVTAEEIIELVKIAMILSGPTCGFIIDEFPVSQLEANLFDQLLYPSTSLVYFLNVSWTSNKKVEPPVEIPKYFRRIEPYKESQVEKVCDSNGYKAIKIWNAEDLDEEGMRAIRNIIQECITSSRGKAKSRPFNHSATCYNATPRKNLLPERPLLHQTLNNGSFAGKRKKDHVVHQKQLIPLRASKPVQCAERHGKRYSDCAQSDLKFSSKCATHTERATGASISLSGENLCGTSGEACSGSKGYRCRDMESHEGIVVKATGEELEGKVGVKAENEESGNFAGRGSGDEYIGFRGSGDNFVRVEEEKEPGVLDGRDDGRFVQESAGDCY